MEEKKTRLASIDALRGFDMFFIIGGAGLIIFLAKAFGCASDCELIKQMEHVPWEGIRHHDTIFPLFLFLAGVSWPFSLSSQLAKGRTMLQIYGKILLRAAILFSFGLMYGGLLQKYNPELEFRIPSVLGFIGLSWAIGAIIFLHVKKTWMRLSLIGALLVGYWAVLHFIAAPGSPAGCDTYARQFNIISWLDRTLMSGYIYRKDYDPESLFAIAGGVATALLGMTAGSVLKCDALKPAKKTLFLLAGFAALIVLDMLFIYAMGDKIVKSLWSPSFVLSAAAYSTAMLALFYHVIDVWGFKKWAFCFKVIGMNSITIYMLTRIIWFPSATKFFFGWLVGYVGANCDKVWVPVVDRFCTLAIIWAFLYFLYRKKIFLKV